MSTFCMSSSHLYHLFQVRLFYFWGTLISGGNDPGATILASLRLTQTKHQGTRERMHFHRRMSRASCRTLRTWDAAFCVAAEAALACSCEALQHSISNHQYRNLVTSYNCQSASLTSAQRHELTRACPPPFHHSQPAPMVIMLSSIPEKSLYM